MTDQPTPLIEDVTTDAWNNTLAFSLLFGKALVQLPSPNDDGTPGSYSNSVDLDQIQQERPSLYAEVASMISDVGLIFNCSFDDAVALTIVRSLAVLRQEAAGWTLDPHVSADGAYAVTALRTIGLVRAVGDSLRLKVSAESTQDVVDALGL